MSPRFARHEVDPAVAVKWVNRPASGLLTGLIFSDGSALFPRRPALRRAGWSLVQVDNFGELVAAAYGPVPFEAAPYQQARDGEDYALHMAPFLVEAPFVIYVDCQGTLDSLCRPPAFSTGPSNERAHLWLPFWAGFEPSDFEAHKTKAHTSHADVGRGLTTAWERKANALADTYAKLGAGLHRLNEQDRWLYEALLLTVQETALWVGRLSAHVSSLPVRDADPLPQGKAQCHADEAEGVELQVIAAGEDGDLVVDCADSGPAARGVARPDVLKANGHTLVAADVLPTVAGHERVIYCATCGAYAWKRFRQLKGMCRGNLCPELKAQRATLRKRMLPASKGLRLGPEVTLSSSQKALVEKVTRGSIEGPSFAQSGPASSARLVGRGVQQLSREHILMAYGLRGDEDVQEAIRWAKMFAQTRRPNEESGASSSGGEDWPDGQ